VNSNALVRPWTTRRIGSWVLVAVLAASIAGCHREPEPPLNLLLVSIDTLRPDHLGCYGYGKDTSPVIDGLSGRGVTYRNAISTSAWTLPAHVSLFTSLPESVHRVDRDWTRIDERRVTLAEVLRDAGYVTAGFYTGPYLHPAFGFDQGFDVYEGCMDYLDRVPAVLRGATTGDEIDGVFERFRNPDFKPPPEEMAVRAEIDRLSHADRTSAVLAERAVSWLEANQTSTFFLFLHFFDAHYDFIPPPPYDEMFRDPDAPDDVPSRGFLTDPRISADMSEAALRQVISQYDGEIRWVDHNLGLVLDAVDRLGLRDRTLVVVTSDHGEEFFEHGGKGHRRTLYDEVIRVPLIFSSPGVVPEGLIDDSVVSLVDILPTIAGLLGVEPPAEATGRDLRPTIAADATGVGRPVLSELVITRPDGGFGRLQSLRTSRHKVIGDLEIGTLDHFDLVHDPGERAPCNPTAGPECGDDGLGRQLAAIAKNLEELGRSLERSDDGTIAEPDEEIRQRLHALGYIEN